MSAKASVPADAARQYAWVPGQAFTGRIILLVADEAITVPNVALSGNGGQAEVNVLEGGEPTPRPVVVGVRGPSRTQVVEGLAVGDRVLLATADALPGPEAGEAEDTDTDAEKTGATP